MQELKARPENAQVLAYLEKYRPSAHSDVAQELMNACKGLALAAWHCPNGAAYSYLYYHAAGIIFALAYGQRRVALRLSGAEQSSALGSGALENEKLGPDWAVFELFKAEVPSEAMRADLKKWVVASYLEAARKAPPITRRLAVIEALLRRHGRHVQANLVAKLLDWRATDPARFKETVESKAVWDGADSVWRAELHGEDARAFDAELAALAEELAEAGYKKRTIGG